MRNDNRKAEIIAFAVFVVPLIYMGLKIAPYMSNGLISILNSFGEIFAQPFKITLQIRYETTLSYTHLLKKSNDQQVSLAGSFV